MTGFILLDISYCREEFRWLRSISTIYDKGKEKWVPQKLSGKESTYSGETQIQSLGQEDPLEKEMANPSSILAWRIAWTKETGRPQSMGLQRVGHNSGTNTSFLSWYSRRMVSKEG